MPLDMRIDASLEVTAADIINGYDEKSLADLIFEYGQDRASRRIARYIVQQRQREPITTTGQLAAVVAAALRTPGGKHKPRHPATRTFQALRIAVNHELDNLRDLLAAAPGLLRKDGWIAIISYHSLEDGLVKRDFKANAGARPLSPPHEEADHAQPGRDRRQSQGPQRQTENCTEDLTPRGARMERTTKG